MWYWVVEMMRGIEKVMGKREGRKRGFVCVCVCGDISQVITVLCVRVFKCKARDT